MSPALERFLLAVVLIAPVLLAVAARASTKADHSSGRSAAAAAGGSAQPLAQPSTKPFPVAPNQNPQPAAGGLGALLDRGEIGLKSLQEFSFISGKTLSHEKDLTVYSGFKDPVFQVVLWGSPQKPDRVLIEFNPKKHEMATLTDFNQEWDSHFPQFKARHGRLEDFSRDNASHLGAYCGKLPASASCETLVWETARGRVVRLNIVLPMGPPVPKAIEYERHQSK